MAKCNQCGKPAIVEVNGSPLCVSCYSQFQTTITSQQQMLAAMLNYLEGQMASVVGMPWLAQKIDIPKAPPVVHYNPMNFHNFKIDNSTVGVINTGEVQRIDVTLDLLKQVGQTEAATRLQEFTQAVINAQELAQDQRNETLELLSLLSSQITTQLKDRKPGLIKSALASISTTAGAVTALAKAWQAAEPILRRIFGM